VEKDDEMIMSGSW